MVPWSVKVWVKRTRRPQSPTWSLSSRTAVTNALIHLDPTVGGDETGLFVVIALVAPTAIEARIYVERALARHGVGGLYSLVQVTPAESCLQNAALL